MLSRSRRARHRSRFALENLESRTLMSAQTDNALPSHWFVAGSYASLHLRPVADTPAPRPTAPRAAATSTGLSRLASSAETAAPPAFLSALTVDVNPDGTAGAYIQYQPREAGTHAATARWDGGAPFPVLIDQPGENNPAGIGAVYALHDALLVGTHTLELTLTNTTRGGSATISTSFNIASVEPSEPDFVASPNASVSESALSPDDDFVTSEPQ